MSRLGRLGATVGTMVSVATVVLWPPGGPKREAVKVRPSHASSQAGEILLCKTMGMDVDGPQNDKGLYAVVPVQPRMTIRGEDVVAWSTFRGKLGGRLRVGFMSQVSPDGAYVVTTINDLNQRPKFPCR